MLVESLSVAGRGGTEESVSHSLRLPLPFFHHLYLALSFTNLSHQFSSTLTHIFFIIYCLPETEENHITRVLFFLSLISFIFNPTCLPFSSSVSSFDPQTLLLSAFCCSLFMLFPRDPIPRVKLTGYVTCKRKKKNKQKKLTGLFPRTCVC